MFDPVYGFGGMYKTSNKSITDGTGNGPYINSTDDDSVRLHVPGKTGGGP